MEWYEYLLIALGGFMAGIINTLAGNGSAITLSILLFTGLPADVANATNRMGVLMQTTTAVGSLRRTNRTKLLFKHALWYLPIAVAGSVAGALLAVDIDEEVLKTVIGVIMLLLLLTLIFRPGIWGKSTDISQKRNKWLHGFLILLTAFYGGFVQMGIGIILLSVLVLLSGYGIKDANIIKLTLALVFVVPAFVVFAFSGDMLLLPGLALALGMGIGARLAARRILYLPKAQLYVRWVLIAILSISSLVLLKIPQLLKQLIYGWG